VYLLDTNVVSELRKLQAGRAAPAVVRWAGGVDSSTLFLSVISLMELDTGVRLLERRDPAQGQVLRGWLEQRVLPAFEGRVLSVDSAISRCAAALQVPDPRPLADTLIAATALVHGLTVVTRNLSDFLPLGVTVFDPWAE
jgi:toxin FitB